MDELEDTLNALCEAFNDFDRLLWLKDRQLWERWKAGGKAVTSEFVSMYPSAEECFEQLLQEVEDDE